MSRFGVVLIMLALSLPVQVSAQPKAPDSFNEDSDELLIGPARQDWQAPRSVLRLLSIRSGETIGELGAGKGFFTYQFSTRVGPMGKVYAVENNPDLIAHLQEYATTFDTANTVVVHGGDADPRLPEGQLDLVFAANTWHRVKDRNAMRERVWRALKPGGRFVVIDWRLEESPLAPPVGRRLGRSALIAEMEAHGWTLTTDSRVLQYQYFLIFTRPAN